MGCFQQAMVCYVFKFVSLPWKTSTFRELVGGRCLCGEDCFVSDLLCCFVVFLCIGFLSCSLQFCSILLLWRTGPMDILALRITPWCLKSLAAPLALGVSQSWQTICEHEPSFLVSSTIFLLALLERFENFKKGVQVAILYTHCTTCQGLSSHCSKEERLLKVRRFAVVTYVQQSQTIQCFKAFL